MSSKKDHQNNTVSETMFLELLFRKKGISDGSMIETMRKAAIEAGYAAPLEVIQRLREEDLMWAERKLELARKDLESIVGPSVKNSSEVSKPLQEPERITEAASPSIVYSPETPKTEIIGKYLTAHEISSLTGNHYLTIRARIKKARLEGLPINSKKVGQAEAILIDAESVKPLGIVFKEDRLSAPAPAPEPPVEQVNINYAKNLRGQYLSMNDIAHLTGYTGPGIRAKAQRNSALTLSEINQRTRAGKTLAVLIDDVAANYFQIPENATLPTDSVSKKAEVTAPVPSAKPEPVENKQTILDTPPLSSPPAPVPAPAPVAAQPPSRLEKVLAAIPTTTQSSPSKGYAPGSPVRKPEPVEERADLSTPAQTLKARSRIETAKPTPKTTAVKPAAAKRENIIKYDLNGGTHLDVYLDQTYNYFTVAAALNRVNNGIFSPLAVKNIFRENEWGESITGERFAQLLDSVNGMMSLGSTSTQKTLVSLCDREVQFTEVLAYMKSKESGLSSKVRTLPGLSDEYILKTDIDSIGQALSEHYPHPQGNIKGVGKKVYDDRLQFRASDFHIDKEILPHRIALLDAGIRPDTTLYSALISKGIVDHSSIPAARQTYKTLSDALVGHEAIDINAIREDLKLEWDRFNGLLSDAVTKGLLTDLGKLSKKPNVNFYVVKSGKSNDLKHYFKSLLK